MNICFPFLFCSLFILFRFCFDSFWFSVLTCTNMSGECWAVSRTVTTTDEYEDKRETTISHCCIGQFYLYSHMRCAHTAYEPTNSFKSSSAGTGRRHWATGDRQFSQHSFFTVSHIAFLSAIRFVWLEYRLFFHLLLILCAVAQVLRFSYCGIVCFGHFEKWTISSAIQWIAEMSMHRTRLEIRSKNLLVAHSLRECRKWSFTFTLHCEKIETKRFDFHGKRNKQTDKNARK